MKRAGFVLVLVGTLVASLLLLNTALTPQVAASSDKTTIKPANNVVVGACSGELSYCCVNENGRTVCGCYAVCPDNTIFSASS
jgi:hypothetical protein